jgi:hypothetical protein
MKEKMKIIKTYSIRLLLAGVLLSCHAFYITKCRATTPDEYLARYGVKHTKTEDLKKDKIYLIFGKIISKVRINRSNFSAKVLYFRSSIFRKITRNYKDIYHVHHAGRIRLCYTNDPRLREKLSHRQEILAYGKYVGSFRQREVFELIVLIREKNRE